MSDRTKDHALAAVTLLGTAVLEQGLDTAVSVLTSAASGIRSNLRGLQQIAHEIASATANGKAPTEFADSLVQQQALEASANVIRRVDVAIGSLIDTRA